MDIFTGLIVYFLIWWVVIFAVLPLGVRRDAGIGTGAPEKPLLREKFIVTTIISLILWALVYVLVSSNLLDFRGLSEAMMREDLKPMDTKAPMP